MRSMRWCRSWGFFSGKMSYACAGYPPGADRLPNAKREAETIVRRLQKYGILSFGGNYEIAQIQKYPLGSPDLGNYSALFFEALGSTISQLDSSRPYIVTSPGSGMETAKNPVFFFCNLFI